MWESFAYSSGKQRIYEHYGTTPESERSSSLGMLMSRISYLDCKQDTQLNLEVGNLIRKRLRHSSSFFSGIPGSQIKRSKFP